MLVVPPEPTLPPLTLPPWPLPPCVASVPPEPLGAPDAALPPLLFGVAPPLVPGAPPLLLLPPLLCPGESGFEPQDAMIRYKTGAIRFSIVFSTAKTCAEPAWKLVARGSRLDEDAYGLRVFPQEIDIY